MYAIFGLVSLVFVVVCAVLVMGCGRHVCRLQRTMARPRGVHAQRGPAQPRNASHRLTGPGRRCAAGV